MWLCVAISLALLSWLQTGECQFSITTDPVPGVNGYFPGTQNITFSCQVNKGGSRRATSWSKQTSLDREEGRGRQPITSGSDSNFLLSSQGTLGVSGIPDTTILTIVSLTEDLDATIIFCGFEEPLANFTIRIYYPPVLTDGGEVRNREKEELSMDMAEPGSPLAFPFPSQVSWTKDGEEVVGGSSTRVFNYSSIFIGSVQPSDSGLYVLSATNYQLNGGPLLGNATASLTLNVLSGARFSGPGSETVAVVEGESATLVCGTGLSGNPLPTLIWTDNNGRVATAGGRISLGSSGEVVSLTLNSTTQNDTGYWNCSAQVYDGANVVGQPVGRDIRLVVVVPPVAPVDLSIKEIGATWIYLQWFNPSAGLGNPPLSSHVVMVQEVGGEVEERTFDSSEGEANVTDLLPRTQYTFSVVAVSQFEDRRATSPPSNSDSGTTNVTVPLVVCREPKVQDRELVISWRYAHTGGLNITSTLVLYSNDSTTYAPLPSSGSGSSGSGSGSRGYYPPDTSVSIPLPVAGVTYYFRVMASNDEGSTTSDCLGFFLTTGIPFVPEQPEFISCSNDGVNLTLSTNYSGVSNTTLDSFQFMLHVYSAANESVLGDAVVLPVMCSSDGGNCSETHLISNLSLSSQSYNISVSASNRFGSSGPSTVFTFPGDICSDSPDNPDSSGSDGSIVVLIVLIGASVGGLILFGALCVIAVTCVVRGRNNTSESPKENFKSPTYTPTTPVTVDLRPPIASNTLQLHGQDTFETYDNCITYEAVEEEQQTTFTPLTQEEALYQQRQEVETASEAALQEEEEEVEEEGAAIPDNDAAMYEAMVLEAGVDDDYEELTTPVYDVPRRAICEAPAYNNIGGNSNIGCEGLAYNNVGGNSNNGRPTVLYSPLSTSRLV